MRVPRLLSSCLKLSCLLLISVGAYSQYEIKVLDETNKALPGVSVYVDNQPYNTTDPDGLVTLPQNFQTAEFSYLAYKNFYLSVNDVKSQNYSIHLIPKDEIIEEVLVIGRTNALSTEVPFRVETITAKEILSSQAQTSADAISKSGEVYVQKSQMGGGSPVLRGFEANKILLVVDGVRLNNAIYRSGHLQNAITIDPAVLSRAELIFGPGSLLYGSDALGGVIHFRTKNPIIDSEPFNGNAYVRYGSANQEKTAHVDFLLSNQSNFASLTSVSLSDFGDLLTGTRRNDRYPDWGKRFEYVSRENNNDEIIVNDNVNRQIGTGYTQFDVLQKFAYSPVDDVELNLNLQFSTSSDIPRYDFLSEYRNGTLRYAEWYYGPQQRILISPQLIWAKENIIFDKVQLIPSFQKIDEDRMSRNFGAVHRETRNEDLHIIGLNFDFQKEISQKHTLEYGGSFYHNMLSSSAFSTNVQSLERQTNILTRYPSDGSSLSQFGLYLHHKWDILQNFFLNVGSRFAHQQVAFNYDQNDPFLWPAYYYEGIENQSSSLVWMAGLNYQGERFQAKLLSGTSFRAPNIDDLAKVRVKIDEITIPNPDLSPEKTLNIEANLQYTAEIFKMGISGFASQIDDLIIRRPFTLPDGSGVYVQGQDSLLVTANVNAKTGTVKGISLVAELEPLKNITLSNTLTITDGESETNGEISPLDHIPPLYGKAELKYSSAKTDQRLVVYYNGEKPIDQYGGSADNPEYATTDGTPAWSTLNYYSSFRLNNGFQIQAAVENIFDIHYRPFASGVSAPGRNFILTLNYKW